MSRRLTLPQLVVRERVAAAKMRRAFRAWEKALLALTRAERRADAEFAKRSEIGGLANWAKDFLDEP